MSAASPTPPRRGGPPPIRKSLGQHFLTDRRVLHRIVDALELTGSETVLEIGPGRGALTELLLGRAGRLVVVEYDRALAALLRERWGPEAGLEVIEADVLTVDLAAVAGGPFVLVGNVPYYITTPIIFHAMRAPRPQRAVYLVQREVGDRMAAAPGTDDYGALSVNVQAFARVERITRVPPGAFNPPPKVESAVVRLVPLDTPLVTPDEEVRFSRLVIDAFGMRRKQLRRALRSIARVTPERAEEILRHADLEPEARPETLSPHDFVRLLRAISPGSSARS